jgi:hypothetical protein
LVQNLAVAERRFLLLLYARHVCFRVFLQCAKATEGGITDDHKVRWLLIQVAPKTLLEFDIFLECTRSAGKASIDYLEGAIQRESNCIKRLIPQQPALFCVLDEAQVLIENEDYFQSDKHPLQGRTVLRPILTSWRSILPNLIVSGTGLSMQEVESVVGSVVAKAGDSVKAETDVGGFDDEVSQRTYLKEYFPEGDLDKPEGKAIASRVGYWLRGRFVFNATI